MPLDVRQWVGMVQTGTARTLPKAEEEVRYLLAEFKRFAPPSVKPTLFAEKRHVFSTAPHARESSFGGVIRPKRARWLFVPLRGARVHSRSPNLVTVPRGDGFKRYVIDKRSKKLVAVRMKAVTLRGSRWIDRALAEHKAKTEERLRKRAELALTRGR